MNTKQNIQPSTIYKLRKIGLQVNSIAEVFGISPAEIYEIMRVHTVKVDVNAVFKRRCSRTIFDKFVPANYRNYEQMAAASERFLDLLKSEARVAK
jgi:hypothetical protein